MGQTSEEAERWSAASAGSGEAFAGLFDLHRDRVYRHAVRLLGNKHDAEDVTAGAFLELWRRRDAVRLVGGSVLAWLLVTTSNLSRNAARSLRRYRAFLKWDSSGSRGSLSMEGGGQGRPQADAVDP